MNTQSMATPHMPTMKVTVGIIVVAFVLYHFTLGRKK